MLVGTTSYFRCPCLLPSCKGSETREDTETTDTLRDETMTKKQRTGLVYMVGSAAVAIQLTIFSPILRGWFYSICLVLLIIVFASGADMFRGNE
jgi:hypothetical protein